MGKQKKSERRILARVARVERKCDRILSELLVIRHRLSRPADGLDTAIDRIHEAASRMRRQCEREHEALRDFLNG